MTQQIDSTARRTRTRAMKSVIHPLVAWTVPHTPVMPTQRTRQPAASRQKQTSLSRSSPQHEKVDTQHGATGLRGYGRPHLRRILWWGRSLCSYRPATTGTGKSGTAHKSEQRKLHSHASNRRFLNPKQFNCMLSGVFLLCIWSLSNFLVLWLILHLFL